MYLTDAFYFLEGSAPLRLCYINSKESISICYSSKLGYFFLDQTVGCDVQCCVNILLQAPIEVSE